MNYRIYFIIIFLLFSCSERSYWKKEPHPQEELIHMKESKDPHKDSLDDLLLKELD